MTRLLVLGATVGVAVWAAPGAPSALAEGDTVAGLDVARQVCATCHVVEDAGQGSDAVPSFRTIANTPNMTDETLRALVIHPNPRMPDPQLSNQEVANIVAYIKSLRK